MSKAIAGAALIVGSAAAYLVAGALTGGVGYLTNAPIFLEILGAVAAAGVSMEASAIGQALTDNRGMSITTRQTAGLRQHIRGTQRVGGTAVYMSTTGVAGASGVYAYNWIIALAAHQINAVQNIYLDGRQVYWNSTNGHVANVGCGTIPTTPSSAPPVAIATLSGHTVSGITATGGHGFSNVKPTRYRVRISGGDASTVYTGQWNATTAYVANNAVIVGPYSYLCLTANTNVPPAGSGDWVKIVNASAYATLAGGSFFSATGINQGSAVGGTWTVTMVTPGAGFTSAPDIDIQGLYTVGGQGANDQQDPSVSGYGLGYGIGPGGPHYQFQNLVFAEIRFGDQVPGDYMASLTADDNRWPTTANGAGVAYLFLQVGYNTAQFPNVPEIRMTIDGKETIFDPRDGTKKFTTNWALQVADVITDPIYGLNDPTVNQAQLIVAANICDESSPTSQGPEARYAQCLHWDTGTAPGDVLAMMMPTAAGRFSRVGGEWFIFPAAWVTASATWDETTLVDGFSWKPYRKERELVNYVQGTYVAPNFPYSALPPQSNLYDQNGWYYGTIANNWNYAFQPTSFPNYAQDQLHGYAANEWLIEDGGVPVPYELTLRGVPSITQAQRLAKIALMKNRFQASCPSLPCNMTAWQSMPLDVIEFNFPALGLDSTDGDFFEIQRMDLTCEPRKDENGEDGAMALTVPCMIQQTDPSIYEWSITEELLPTDVAALGTNQIPATPAPPTSMTVISSAGTAVVGADGSVFPRAEIEWAAPLDSTVTEIQIQYQLVGAGAWLNGGTVDVALFAAFVGNVIAGQLYNFRIRSLRPSGTFSTWVEVDNVLISITLAIIVTSGIPVTTAGTLVGYAEPLGMAEIVVEPFTASIGLAVSVSCLPAGAYTITGLHQSEMYWVYYIDPSFLGGAITPIATQNTADFLNKLGYYLIGSLITPSGAGIVYRPVAGPSTSGTVSVVYPTYCFDGNPSDETLMGGHGPGGYNSQAIYWHWPSLTTTAAATLNVNAAALAYGSGCLATIQASLDGGSTWTTMLSTAVQVLLTNYTLPVPSGQDLALVQVKFNCSGDATLTGYIDLYFASLYIE
ncbi:MAG TPA: hypothetical protein VII58_00810 [Acidobacteriaceae bacterium]